MSESFEVFVEDSSGNISVDQLLTSLYGLSIEAMEVNSIDTGIFSVVVSNPQEKERLLNMGCLEINSFLLTISGNSEDIQCPICTISMKNWNESERNSHIITCGNEYSGTDTVQPDGPFTLNCPYPSCGLRMEARLFPSHSFSKHSKDKQNYPCPICQLQGDTKYKVKPDTNLMTHLDTSHPDIVESPYGSHTYINNYIPLPKPKPIKGSKLQYSQPSDYLVSIIQHDTLDECPICYEIFVKGIKIARLPCLCVYHQHCVEAWFRQKAARKCPLHGMDNT